MQDKLIEILRAASGWMTAGEIAEAGKWRSAANVGLALKNLGDRVVSRTSKTKRNASTCQYLKEWAMADATFAAEHVAKPAEAKPEEAAAAEIAEKQTSTAKLEPLSEEKLRELLKGVAEAVGVKPISDEVLLMLPSTVQQRVNDLESMYSAARKFCGNLHERFPEQPAPLNLSECLAAIDAAKRDHSAIKEQLSAAESRLIAANYRIVELEADNFRPAALLSINAANGHLVIAGNDLTRRVSIRSAAEHAKRAAAKSGKPAHVYALRRVGTAKPGAVFVPIGEQAGGQQ